MIMTMINHKFCSMLRAHLSLCFFALLGASCINTPSSATMTSSRPKGAKAPHIVVDLIPPGGLNRHSPKKMKPQFITIHSTANQSPKANAEAHVRLLHRSGLGTLSWHFTVDQDNIFQTLPTDEQGQHADYDGPGNQYSIGIEMCENEGNDREKTLEQTAKLTAWLMRKHDIPISQVVPHQHWRRVRPDGKDFGHKDCPHFLMDDGVPGRKWKAFLKQVGSFR
jgi:N-acetylmuramoyl-L-alanine amidase